MPRPGVERLGGLVALRGRGLRHVPRVQGEHRHLERLLVHLQDLSQLGRRGRRRRVRGLQRGGRCGRERWLPGPGQRRLLPARRGRRLSRAEHDVQRRLGVCVRGRRQSLDDDDVARRHSPDPARADACADDHAPDAKSDTAADALSDAVPDIRPDANPV